MRVSMLSMKRAMTTTMMTRGGKSSSSSSSLLWRPIGTLASSAGIGYRVHSGIGSDPSMIAANDRNNNNRRIPKTTFAAQSSLSSFSSKAMEDEYGEMTSDGNTYVESNFVLENGTVLEEAQLRYQTYGQLNETTRDNVLVVCHALTGNASLHSWWGSLLGDGLAFDTSKYYIVCCNILGSCYGSTSPQSPQPSSNNNKPYGKDFPDVSVQDTVRLQLRLLQHELKVSSVKCVIGGSFGGMQAVEFAVQAGRSKRDDDDDDTAVCADNGSPFVKSVVPIACGAYHTAWQIAISEAQRQAIYADPAWSSSDPTKATKGLSVARQMGMISYRTAQGYQSKFGRELKDASDKEEEDVAKYGAGAVWQAKSYLEYQGEKFLSRFDPVTYVKLTEQMDSHDVSRGRKGSVADVLGTVEIPALVMGIDSDVLYPLSEQEELANGLPNSTLRVIQSDDGHDGFLLEQDQVGTNITEFLNKLD